LLAALVGILAIMSLGSLAMAQNPPPSAPPPAQSAAPLTPAQLDQLTAPIALYPDDLLGQILIAATYPLEIVQADRWVKDPANAALKGDQLTAALVQQPWDPSVKSLVAFPQVLKMMDGNLTWTEQLGDAFLASQAGVMDSVQRLRQQAEAAGKLQSTTQMAVSTVDGACVIAPTDPTSVYVPVYNPNDIYGAWAYPDYPPDYFPGYFPGVEIGPFGFGWFDVGIVGALWGWDSWDWRGHRINIDGGRFNAMNRDRPAISSGAWQHDPSHRGGVPYRDPAVRARFQGAATADRTARGFPAGAAAESERAGRAGGPAAAEAERGATSGRPGAGEAERGATSGRPGAAEGERGATAGRPAGAEAERGATGGRPVAAEAGRGATAGRPAGAESERAAAPRAPAAERRAPPVTQSVGRGTQVRAEAQRGQASRASAPRAAARSAPSGGGKGGGGGGKGGGGKHK